MFEGLIEKPRRRRWQTPVIVGSAVLHAAALAAVAVAAMWKIDKLDLVSATDITFRVPAPPGDSAPPPAARLSVPRAATTKVTKVKPQVPVQPTVVKDPEPVTAGPAGAADPDGSTTGPGGDGTDPDGDPLATGRCLTPPCLPGGTGEQEPPPAVEPPKKPTIVPPSVARGLRISGNEQIHPPESVRVEMLHQGKESVQATVQVCVGPRGTVDQLRMMKSTGFQAYDDTLLREMRAWRYRPYLVDGKPETMCSVAVVIYRMRK